MTHLTAIVLILGLCLPQALIAGEVLQAGEIDSSKVKVGAYAEVFYGTGEKLSTARGYIRAVDAESLTISQGFEKRIAFERIQKLILAETDREIGRLKEITDTLSVKKENKPMRIVGKLAGGILAGTLVGLAVGSVAEKAAGDCTGTFCGLGQFITGGWYGYLGGVPIGVSLFDPHDRFTYSLAGSLIGGAAGLGMLYISENSWPALVISPLIGAAIMSEFFRKPPESRRVSIGLLPGPKGRVSAVAILRF